MLLMEQTGFPGGFIPAFADGGDSDNAGALRTNGDGFSLTTGCLRQHSRCGFQCGRARRHNRYARWVAGVGRLKGQLHLLVGCALVALQAGQVIGPLIQDLLGNRRLAAHCTHRHHCTGNIKLYQ